MGQQVARALETAAPALAGLSLMIERGKGSPTLLRTLASQLEGAATILRKAAGDD